MLEILLKPITLVINRLSYTWKFVVLSLLFIGVLAAPIYELYNYVNGSNNFSEKEITGMRYIDPLKELLFSLNSYHNARLANSGVTANFNALQTNWEAVEKAEARHGEILATQKLFEDLKKNYSALKDKANALSDEQLFSTLDELESQIIGLISTIGTNSNLVLDPDTDSYYVMDTIVYRLPPLAQYINQYQQHANSLIAKGSMSLQDEEKLIELKTHLLDTLNLTRGNLEVSLANTRNKALFNQMSQVFKNYFESTTEYIEYIHHGLSSLPTKRMTTGLYHDKVNVLAEQASNDAAKVYDAGTIQMVDLLQKRIERTTEPWLRTLSISSVVLLFIFYVMMGFRLAVVKTVTALSRASQELANGDLTTRVKIETRDELRLVGHAFNQMAESFNQLIGELKTNANNVSNASETLSTTSVQMQHEAESLSELSKTANQLTDSVDSSIKTMAAAVEQSSANINEVSRASAKVGQNIQSVQSSAEDVSNRMQNIAESAQEMSSSVNTVAAAIEEMSSSLNEVSRNAAKAAKVASVAENTANTTNETVNVLGTSAREIENVLGVIKDIASQTNLLALNATIEAASAGEAGKGFAVVANEVKALAKLSAEATEDIRLRIEKMQSNTNAAVDAIEQILSIISEINQINTTIASAVAEQTATVNEISRSVSGAAHAAKQVTLNVQQAAETSTSVSAQVNEASHSITLITTNISELAQGTNEISKGASEASSSASQMAVQVEQVNQTSVETEQGASSLNLTAQELSTLAHNLKNVVERFKIAV